MLKCDNERKRLEEFEGGAMSRVTWAALRSRKDKGRYSPLKPPEGTSTGTP